MKKKWLNIIVLLALLIGCMYAVVRVIQDRPQQWGSFTNQSIISDDRKYRAEHNVKKIKGYTVSMIQVDVYDNQTNEVLSSFVPARAMDFWGLCWEDNTHNIWIQSADIGVYCYVPQNGKWVPDENAVQPESIVSKWDNKK